MLWKTPNELFGQLNIMCLTEHLYIFLIQKIVAVTLTCN